MECRRCNRAHDGSMMRTDRRYTRVRDMLLSEAATDGRLVLCHYCQRQAYFAGSVLRLLVRDLTHDARFMGRAA